MDEHEFRLQDGTILRGYVSRNNPEDSTVLVIPKDSPGMVGKDGIPYRYEDLKSVFAEERGNPGVFVGPDLLISWRRAARSR